MNDSISRRTQHIQTNNIMESYPQILNSVCESLYDFLINDDIIRISNDISIILTYSIKDHKKCMRETLKCLGKYKKITNNDLNHKCPICLEYFKKNEYKRVIKCNHMFHKKCIDKWLYKTNNCPLCRVKII